MQRDGGVEEPHDQLRREPKFVELELSQNHVIRALRLRDLIHEAHASRRYEKLFHAHVGEDSDVRRDDVGIGDERWVIDVDDRVVRPVRRF